MHKIITTQEEAILYQQKQGNDVIMRCKLHGAGLEFLAYGTSVGDTLKAMKATITTYLDSYDSI